MTNSRTALTTALTAATLGAGLLAPATATTTGATTSGATATSQVAADAQKAPKKVTKAQARKVILRVHRLGKAGKYRTMRRYASASVVNHYRTWNAMNPEFPDARTQWRYAGNCMTLADDSYWAYSQGKGRAGCAISVWLVGSDPEVADYSFLTVKRKNGKLYVNSINHLAG